MQLGLCYGTILLIPLEIVFFFAFSVFFFFTLVLASTQKIHAYLTVSLINVRKKLLEQSSYK